MSVQRSLFGHLQDGRPVHSILIRDDGSGFAVQILEYGAILRAIHVPDRQRRLVNVILAYDALGAYEVDQAYLGALIGRCANRIANGTALVEQRQLQLTTNHGAHHLHGGETGFGRALWRTIDIHDGTAPAVALEHHSPDGDQGYPGNVKVRVTFRITSAYAFDVVIKATADRATPLDLTLHPYFNLAGDPGASIDQHQLRIDADAFLQTSLDGIPTGHLLSVTDTPFDFRRAANIGVALARNHPQQLVRDGYDHYWILNKATPVEVELFSPKSGIRLQLSTNQAGIQFYSGGLLHGGTAGSFPDRAGLCLEPHGFPNAVNESRFPSAILDAGKEYLHVTSYAFSAQPSGAH